MYGGAATLDPYWFEVLADTKWHTLNLSSQTGALLSISAFIPFFCNVIVVVVVVVVVVDFYLRHSLWIGEAHMIPVGLSLRVCQTLT